MGPSLRAVGDRSGVRRWVEVLRKRVSLQEQLYDEPNHPHSFDLREAGAHELKKRADAM